MRRARELQRQGKPPDGKLVVPGVMPWAEYRRRRDTWDKVRQCVGLDAEFWEGADALLFPPDWLTRAERVGRMLEAAAGLNQAGVPRDKFLLRVGWGPDLGDAADFPPLPRERVAKGVGCDPAEGGDKTAFCAVDEWGVIELVSKPTPDTSVIRTELAAFVRRHLRLFPGVACPPSDPDWLRVCIDRGGGGKQIADEMRAAGMPVRTVAFGEPVQPEPRLAPVGHKERVDVKEDKYAYLNRRAEMYGELSLRMDPARQAAGLCKPFGIPREYVPVLRPQMAPVPRIYDGEGRMKLPKKHKRDKNDKEVTLVDMIGHSPDELDALVLADYGMRGRPPRGRAGGPQP